MTTLLTVQSPDPAEVAARAAAGPLRPLQVVEVFGPTFQGEGPNLGRRCGFIRLADCNLACGWCDTRYSWDWTTHDRQVEVTEQTVDALTDQVLGMGVNLVIVTGGEPLLQKHALGPLLLNLRALGIASNVETNGTIPPSGFDLPDLFCVSLKLGHSGDPLHKRIRPRSVEAFAELARHQPGMVAWKPVCATEADLAEVQDLQDRYGLHPDDIWIMPEGTTPNAIADHLDNLAGPVLERGWHLTTRLHVTLWSDTRAR